MRRGGGGKVNCEAEGMNVRMREAAFGEGYSVAVGPIHADGERWSFERLVEFSFRGIVEWYCKQRKTDLRIVRAIPELAVLGAFFHRFKVVDEAFWAVEARLGRAHEGRSFFAVLPEPMRTRVYTKQWAAAPSPDVKKIQAVLATEASRNAFLMLRLPINIALDRTQCLLYYVCKHEELPDGFRMDPRIERWARTPIAISLPDGRGKVQRLLDKEDLQSPSPQIALSAVAQWITVFETVAADLMPEVTFGVF